MSLTKGPRSLGELLDAARSAWPDVEVPADVFASYVRGRVPAGDNAADVYVRRMRASDLYLACACARGDSRAIELFERHCLSVVDATLSRMVGMNGDVVDDIKQQLRRRLLVAEGGPPGIVQFSGTGELRRWLKVLAVREALRVRRRTCREDPAGDNVLERALLPAGDPHLDYLKRLYQHEFATAIAQALPTLKIREQTILRQSFVDGLTIDELGRCYRVHRATAARWLAGAQSRLSRATRLILKRRLNVNRSELSSILRLIRSGLELSLTGVFPPPRERSRHRLLEDPAAQ